MIGYLQCLGCFNSRLIIGPTENQLQPVTIAEVKGLLLIGHFAYITNERFLFYRWNGDLRLRRGDTPSISLSGVQINWMHSSNNVQVILKKESKIILEKSYFLNPRIKSIDNDPTPFIEPEDFDFFLFVRNVLADNNRSKIIYFNPK